MQNFVYAIHINGVARYMYSKHKLPYICITIPFLNNSADVTKEFDRSAFFTLDVTQETYFCKSNCILSHRAWLIFIEHKY